MKCGLLGQKLAHSYSPEIHKYLGSYSYCLFETEPEALGDFLTGNSFDGINVTIPYKKAVIPYCSGLTEVARRLGAVNTIVRREDGTLMGHNTDYYGFSSMLKLVGVKPQNKKVLVLGSGGASNTVCAVLQELGAQVTVISRQGKNHYGNLELHRDAAVIVNTTPVGMYPNNGSTPLSLELFPHLEAVLDLIYNPAKTQLILDAQSRNIPAVNGLWMLIAQAKESAELFTGTKISEEQIAVIYRAMESKMTNLILIGMPGCGKSTVGNILADKLGRRFVDADAYLEQKLGISIPELFQTQGEAEFRKQETLVLSELGKQSGLVIATGGGCVTRQENYPLLQQNGKIIWLKRSLDSLPKDGRPLSQSTALDVMYSIREPLYRAFSHYQVENNSSAEAAAEEILKLER